MVEQQAGTQLPIGAIEGEVEEASGTVYWWGSQRTVEQAETDALPAWSGRIGIQGTVRDGRVNRIVMLDYDGALTLETARQYFEAGLAAVAEAEQDAARDADADQHWRGTETVIEQDTPLFGRFAAVVAAQGVHHRYAGVMLDADRHLTVGTARDLGYAILAAADLAEDVAIAEATAGTGPNR
ncbi:hypothetical protein EB73_11535 [Mycobacterium sp. SWH-M3]|nr:hypothetical protein EB73_11535 [Mycobacterium sp. SWH-M3]